MTTPGAIPARPGAPAGLSASQLAMGATCRRFGLQVGGQEPPTAPAQGPRVAGSSTSERRTSEPTGKQLWAPNSPLVFNQDRSGADMVPGRPGTAKAEPGTEQALSSAHWSTGSLFTAPCLLLQEQQELDQTLRLPGAGWMLVGRWEVCMEQKMED